MHITNGQVIKITFNFSHRKKMKCNRMGIGENGDFVAKVETFDGLGWQILVIFFLSSACWYGWFKYPNSTLVM